MIRPTRTALLLSALGLPVSLLPALVDVRLWPVWLVFSLLLAIFIGVDALLTPRQLQVSAKAPSLLQVGQPARLELELVVPRAQALDVLLDVDALLEPVPEMRVPVIGGRAAAVIRLVPRRRGPSLVNAVWVRSRGPLGLVSREVRHALGLRLSVTCDTTAVRDVALRFAGSPLLQQGLKIEREKGMGSEFESLREFVSGMDTRAVDWKASARHRKLLVRENRAERNHQLVVAVDSGHAMAAPLGELARLDHAVRAALVLAWVALRSGDRVGVFGFDVVVRCWTEPQGGSHAFPRAQQALASLPYSGAETNYTLGMAELSSRMRRRALVVLFTEVTDSTSSELMLENVERLRSRHLVVLVALRDPSIDALATAIPVGLSDLHRSVVAGDLRTERELVLRRLRRMGVHTLDASPREASPRLVSRYLDIKRRELV
jgi:uncharacterized protein (DUF58 family)